MMLQVLACGLAVATAVLVFRSRAERGGARFVLGLWLGVLFAHAGWALVHLEHVIAEPALVLQPGAVSVMFLPLGVLCLAPWREALAALPLALFVARLGCLPYGCCYASVWAAAPELGLLLALHFAARRWEDGSTFLVLSGLGAIRLLSLPLRVPMQVEPSVDPAWIAAAWIAAGVLLHVRLGSAREARAWLGERSVPVLRALALMLAIWLLFLLTGQLLGDGPHALLVASAIGAAVVVWLRLRERTQLASDVSQPVRWAAGGVPAIGLALLLTSFAVASPLAASGVRATALLGDPVRLVTFVMIVPVLEEVLYRGHLLDAFTRAFGRNLALAGSSALFALGHFRSEVMPVAFAGGLLCGAVALRRGRLRGPIVLHGAWNFGALLLASGAGAVGPLTR